MNNFMHPVRDDAPKIRLRQRNGIQVDGNGAALGCARDALLLRENVHSKGVIITLPPPPLPPRRPSVASFGCALGLQ